MTLKEIKSEILYYTGRNVSDDEAQEVAMHFNANHRPIEEIISDYYGCI